MSCEKFIMENVTAHCPMYAFDFCDNFASLISHNVRFPSFGCILNRQTKAWLSKEFKMKDVHEWIVNKRCEDRVNIPFL